MRARGPQAGSPRPALPSLESAASSRRSPPGQDREVRPRSPWACKERRRARTGPARSGRGAAADPASPQPRGGQEDLSVPGSLLGDFRPPLEDLARPPGVDRLGGDAQAILPGVRKARRPERRGRVQEPGVPPRALRALDHPPPDLSLLLPPPPPPLLPPPPVHPP